MKKLVNGEEVICSAQEEAEILASWAAGALEVSARNAKDSKRIKAVEANEEYLMGQTAKLSDAPQAVKDYIANSK